MKKILFIFIVLLAGHAHAQRLVVPLNEGWQFTKDNIENKVAANISWQPVSLPHTWNVTDVLDDAPGYYRGIGWYKKIIAPAKDLQGKQLYISFDGANQQTTLFVNGKKAGEHTGGYTAFTIPITALINPEADNEILVKVDNSHDRNIPPLSADFTFYGGIYRQVALIAVSPVHFSLDDHGSRSVYITTPVVNKTSATVNIKSSISNKNTGEENIKISSTIYDAGGTKITEVTTNISVPGGSNKNVEQDIKNIKNPKLWSPTDPYLYTMVTRITNSTTGAIIDEIKNPLGFRWYHFDAAKGFSINDVPLKLIGTSRHQDFKGMGNAVPATIARKDVALIKEMGGNFLRVAHYPQDPSVLQACDEMGILASVEIPIVNEITESDSFYRNCEKMQVEMIRQNYNHPSLIMWCYMNEVLLRPQFNDNKDRQKIYYASIAKLARRLDSITRKEDPYRYTMIAHPGDFNRYRDAGLIDIPMLVGWNLYSGWYGANLHDFPIFLDRFHKDYPNKPMMVTEYGADADPRIRSTEPVRFDKSIEYATNFHRYYYKEIMQRPFVTAAMIWNLADFNSETRNESMPHMNNKGLLEYDRKPKDPYYYYQAMLLKKPFIKILGSALRSGVADSGAITTQQQIQVAANTGKIMLTINGKAEVEKIPDNGIATWSLPFKDGVNNITVKAMKNGKAVTDRLSVNFRMQAYELADAKIPFRQLNILLGAKRSYTDSSNQVWLPGQAYRKGSWGYVGGKAFGLVNNGRLPYGTDKNIIGTDDDPVYQTQQTGIEAYCFDVPPGNYELVLHFAELQGGKVKSLLYNLSDASRDEHTVKRIFNVAVNEEPWLQQFNMQAYGAATAISKRITVAVKNNGGITIQFTAIEGEPVLNAVQLKKLD